MRMPEGAVLWVGEQAPEGLVSAQPRQVRRCLGRECAVLVFDAHAGFHVDAFAAAMGTLRGGGELLLLLPDWQTWDQLDPVREKFASYPLTQTEVGTRFLARLRRLFDAADCVSVEQEGARLEPFSVQGPLLSRKDFVLSNGQQAVVAAVERVAHGHARRPLILTADRGRGKSTALGFALAGLLREREIKVVLTAPGLDSVQAVFDALQRELPHGQLHAGCFTYQRGAVEFRDADEQLLSPTDCELLVVDEAAAIALPILEQLLSKHNRVVFSSTVHGYEGSGRGFSLRFSRVLDRLCPQRKYLSLEEPVRWQQGDPLEALVNEAALLNAELDECVDEPAVRYQWLSQVELAANEVLLRNLFALLVSAHYQTRPSDLRQLLDAPLLRILVARRGEALLGVALAVEEGGFDVTLAQDVCAGERRPRGHMLVQSLAAHAGLCDAPVLRLMRIMRVAVADVWRGQGIGSALVSKVIDAARDQAFDLFGTAYGVDAPLLRFWRRAGLRVLRLGHRRDHASGTHSVQMALGLNAAGMSLVSGGEARFQQQFPWRLAREFRQLPADVVIALMQGRDCRDLPLSPSDMADVEAFALSFRGFDDALPALWRWLCHELSTENMVAGDADDSLLIAAVLQNRALGSSMAGSQASGPRGQLNTLRLAVARRQQDG